MDETQLIQMIMSKLDNIAAQVSLVTERIGKIESELALQRHVSRDVEDLKLKVAAIETRLKVYTTVALVAGSIVGWFVNLLVGE